MGADLERVQRERDAALERLSQQSSSSETLDKELEAARKQLRRVEVRAVSVLMLRVLLVSVGILARLAPPLELHTSDGHKASCLSWFSGLPSWISLRCDCTDGSRHCTALPG